MRFRAAHKLATYLMVATAVLNIALADALPVLSALLLTLIAIVSFWAEPDTRLSAAIARFDLPIKILAAGYFVFALAGIYRAFPEPESSQLLNLVFFLMGLKLLQRRTNRDYLHLHVLSFLLVLAAAWLAQSAFFAIGFAAYVIVATWALILFHLRREIEDNYLVKHSQASPAQKVTVARVLDSRRVVSGKFFAATGLAALGVLLGAVMVFALAPRIGIGFLTGGVRRRANVVGFNDEVRLGQHGLISGENQTVVLRANVPRLHDMASEPRDMEIANFYWRGTIYDTYANGQWLRSRTDAAKTRLEFRPAQSGGKLWFVRGPEEPDGLALRYNDLKGTEIQELQVVALSHPVAFALDTPIAYEAAATAIGSFTSVAIEGRWSGESALRMERVLPSGRALPLSDFAGASYRAYSRDTIRAPRADRAIPISAWSQDLLDTYLSVPHTLSRRTRDLARRITASENTSAGKARAIMAWLQKSKAYTTDLRRDENIEDPVEDFLFQQPAGHCEYFASSLALLLRLSGIPTRYVNGFLGGEWNELARHITIRDNRAHSWVEAYFDGFGWTRLDATPPAPRSTRMSRLQQIIDSIELWWASWVLEYDAARQVRLARKVTSSLGLRRNRGSFHWPKVNWKQVGTALLLLAAIAYLGREWVRRRRRTGTRSRVFVRPRPALRFYARALDALARAGIHRGASETPRELLARAQRELGDPLQALAVLTRHYERARFGDQAVDDGADELDQHLRALERRVRECLDARPRKAAA